MSSPTLDKPPARPRRDPQPAGTVPYQAAPDEHKAGHDEIPTVDALPRPNRTILVLLGLGLLLVLGSAFVLGYLPKLHRTAEMNAQVQSEADALPAVSVQFPRAAETWTRLELPGSAQPLQETAIYARTTGYLKRWTADYGATVKKDQLLAEIDAPDVDERLRQARATLIADQANISRSELDLSLADVTQKRYESLVKTQGVTPQELDTYHANFARARTTLANAKAALAADEANVTRLEDLQSFERITAPFDGTITARTYDVGALITANGTQGGMPMFRIAETDVLRVWVNVPQSYSTEIKPGLEAKLSVREYPVRTFSGKVAHTAGALDSASRTLLTEVQVPNKEGKLIAGMYAQVTFEVTNPAPPLIVPVSALVETGDGSHVAVIDSQSVLHLKKVEIGRDFGKEVEISNGLLPQDRIVTNPGERTAEGIKVRVVSEEKPVTAPAPPELRPAAPPPSNHASPQARTD